MEADERPWGRYEVLLDAHDCKVKRIVVRPGARLSYQRHAQRAEHWFIVAGVGEVTVDGVVISVTPGSSVDIAMGSAHRMHNTGSDGLAFIEVQRGTYFGEDDIERLEDDFGRTTTP